MVTEFGSSTGTYLLWVALPVVGQVDRARALAEVLLAGPLPRRWVHTQGVAATAGRLAGILGEHAEVVEAAAWLHDIGYSPGVAETGLHALDGARYLRDVEYAHPLVCALVAYHTGAIYEAQERGLELDLISEFTPPPRPLADALTYCDITTGPSGEQFDVQQRIAEILHRYDSDHPVSRTVRRASASFVESVRAIEASLTA